jgi:hypothetical protein
MGADEGEVFIQSKSLSIFVPLGGRPNPTETGVATGTRTMVLEMGS